jgi:RHS repeat-associated protein
VISGGYSGPDFVKALRRFGVTIDYNSDGRMDMVVKFRTDVWSVLRSQGSSFTRLPLTFAGPTDGEQFMVYDADHDGMQDLGLTRTVLTRLGTPNNTLAVIIDGLGARTEILHAEQSQDPDDLSSPPGPVYTHVPPLDAPSPPPPETGCGYPVYCRFPRGEVVRKVHTWDVATQRAANLPSGSPPAARSFFYSYTGAARDLLGRGSLGFESRTIVDGARNALAAASGGIHATTLVFRNKHRVIEGPGAGTYPFVGIVQTYADIVRLPSGRDRLTSAIRQLDVKAPTPRSYFPFVREETQRVVESPASSPSVLKNVVYSWVYDDFGNITHSEAQWADSSDGKPADRVISDTTYVADTAHVEQWLNSLPRTSTVTGTSDVTLSRTQRFTYADDSGGSSSIPFSGRPEMITLEPGNSLQEVATRMTFDARGNVTSIAETGATIDGIRTRRLSLEYDSSAQLFPVKLTARNGTTDHVMDVEYDMPLGLPIGTRNVGRPNSFVSGFEIPDGFGRVQRIVAADGVITNLEYLSQSSGGYSVRSTRAGAPTSQVFYDVLGRERRTETDAFDRMIAADTTYNALGLVKDVSRARAGTASADLTKFTYDALGRVLSATLPPARLVQRCYLDNVECTRNPRGFTSCDVLNEHGQLAFAVQAIDVPSTSCEVTATLVAEQFPADGTPGSDIFFTAARYRYSPFGDVTSIVDPTANTVTIKRDAYGRELEVQDLDRGKFQYTYNAFGEPERVTDPALLRAELRYDDLGRQVRRTDLASGGLPEQVTTFSFDGGFMGKLTRTASPGGVVTSLTYDSFGRLLDFARVVPGASGSQTMARHHEYDTNGRLSILRYDSVNGTQPMRVRYSYNSRGHLSRMSRPNPASLSNPATDTDFWTAVAIDNYGSLTSERFGNGVVTTRAYEPGTGFLDTVRTALNTTDLARWNHNYDLNGNLDTRFNELPGSLSVTKYTYDGLDRMKSAVQRPSLTSGTVLYSEAYNYNAAGNIDQKVVSGTTATAATWTYDYAPTSVRPHAVKKITSGSTNQTYGYDASGNMTSRSAGIQGALALTYNRLQLPSRVGSSPTSSDALTIQYDADGERVRKVRGTAETFYLDENYSRSRPLSTGSFTERLTIQDGERTVAEVSRTTGGTETISFLHRDRLGSVELVTGPAGQAPQRRTYEAYGKRRTVTGTSPVSARVDYTGHELDTEFSLINMKSRLYDPQIGRFISPDSLIAAPWRPQALNPYAYVEGNPVNHNDPTGHQADEGTGIRPPRHTPMLPPSGSGGRSFENEWSRFKYRLKVFLNDVFGGSDDKPTPPRNSASRNFDARTDTQSTSVSPPSAPAMSTGAPVMSSSAPAMHWTMDSFGMPIFQFIPGGGPLQASIDATAQAEARGGLIAGGLVLGGMGGVALWKGGLMFAAYYPAIFGAGTKLASDVLQDVSGGGLAAPRGIATLDAAAIRFSQSSVNGVGEIAKSMAANGWKGAPIDVVKLGDNLVTLDNTRLLAAHLTGTPVQALIRSAGEALPASMAGRFVSRAGVEATTWGEAVMTRIGNQNATYQSLFPSGSWATGVNP